MELKLEDGGSEECSSGTGSERKKLENGGSGECSFGTASKWK
jgi:hypothetical protein